MTTTTDTATKRCSNCKTVKPLDDFNKRTRSHDGRETRCRDCVTSIRHQTAQQRAEDEAALRASRYPNYKPPARADDPDAKRCTKCRTVLPRTFFYKAKTSADGLKSWCKTCCNGHSQIVRARIKEHADASAAANEAGLVDVWPVVVPEVGPDWRHRAACRDEDPELFFPMGTTGPWLLQIEEAKSVCRRCPEMEACLAFALHTGQDAGVWGGMSEDERKALKRRATRNRGSGRAN